MSPQQEEVTVTQETKDKYINILKANGIKNAVKEVLISRPDLKGDHLGSIVEYVTVKFEDGSEDLDLFVKLKAKGSAIVTAMFDAMMLFDKESSFFNSFLPEAKKFCKSRECDDFLRCFAKCYYADPTCIVLENLVKKNYAMRHKSELQGFDEAKVVLKNMGKYQAVSYVMISRMGKDTFAAKYPISVTESAVSKDKEAMFGSMFQNNIRTCCKILEAHPHEGTSETVEWLHTQIEDLYPNLCKAVRNDPEDATLVLNHGDCWNNNMMFLRDNNTNEILDHIFVDLQVTRCGSPNLDISFFLFTTVKSEVRREKLEELLKVYYDSFKETVSSLKGSLRISFEDFVKDYKKKCFLGFIYGLNMKTAIGAIKDVDNEAPMNDLEELKNYFNQIIANWIINNPEKSNGIAKDVIGTVKEYRKLMEN